MEKPRKIYYSITEVAEMAQVKPHVLRYWETEFASLRPRKNRAGNRTYQEKDVRLVLLIRKLLYEDGFTIKGARRRLQEKRGGELPQMEIPFGRLSGAAPAAVTTIVETAGRVSTVPLRELRQELESILAELSS